MIRACKDEFIAQIEHKHVCVTFLERAENGGIGLGRKNDRGARLANNARRAMVGKGRFRPGDDLLPFVGKENDEIVLLPFLGRFVEPVGTG